MLSLATVVFIDPPTKAVLDLLYIAENALHFDQMGAIYEKLLIAFAKSSILPLATSPWILLYD